ncbi:hypothetical protein ACFYQA_19800 [Streptomyces sp. NPDC005774]|uniref:hypothetical protein n=1 Tax=Streptomyces sp. NPDC005774 TaxID=3364728 RepID=UPI0036B4398A
MVPLSRSGGAQVAVGAVGELHCSHCASTRRTANARSTIPAFFHPGEVTAGASWLRQAGTET